MSRSRDILVATRPRVRLFSAAASCTAVMICALFGVTVARVEAASSAPAWSIVSTGYPTNFPPGATWEVNLTKYVVIARNAGGAAAPGPATLTDQLPPGVVTAGAPLVNNLAHNDETVAAPCTTTETTVSCTFEGETLPGEGFSVEIPVNVDASASGTVTNRATVESPSAAAASTGQPTAISAIAAPFGFVQQPAGLSFFATGADGHPATQAGVHPYQITTSLSLATGMFNPEEGLFKYGGEPKGITVNLPQGVVVNPDATTKCTERQLEAVHIACPPSSQVGVVTNLVFSVGPFNPLASLSPVYNMVPPPGKPAELGFFARGVGTYVHVSGGLNTAGGYTLSGTANEIYAGYPPLQTTVTLWGDPSDPSHNAQRGDCAVSFPPIPEQPCTTVTPGTAAPFLTMPTSCSSQPTIAASTDSWQAPGTFVSTSAPATDANGTPVSMSGCDKLDFSPTMSAKPESSAADSPSGFDFRLTLPQDEGVASLGEGTLKKAVVTLPAGASLNPAAAGGLTGCSAAQIRITDASEPSCPDSSKVATVSIKTPLLSDPLTGAVYLATPYENPFGALVAGYIVAQADGALIKLPGVIKLDPLTGRITGEFDNNPQLPFSELDIHFFGGAHGVLATPQACGGYTSNAVFTPWSTPFSADALTGSDFSIGEGPGGGACPSSPLPFAPAVTAGSTSTQAGAYTPFVTSVQRQDGEQDLSGVTVETPRGLLAAIASVPRCGEADANAGTCPESSRVGSVTAAAGVGPSPLSLPESGRREDPVYLTGPYNGGPFGLSIVTHAEAGPFNLGDVVVRASIRVNPVTAQATVVSDPLPQIKDGIPFRLRQVNVNIDRPGFIFNPTSCEQLHVNSTVTGVEGTSSSPSTRFQVANCATLPFKPVFTASTQGHTSKQNGASLHVAIASAGIGQANIRKVELEIPKILPSRLTTLQKACPEAQFNANPAGCPAESDIATAVVHTPLLNSPLSGPVYFVSHGGAAFPDTEIILQGEGVKLILDGHTDIKKGVTYSRFETVPDAPFTSFEFNAPEGPYSIFGADGNLCQTEVRMPTTIVGQNGAVIKQSTLVEPEGCANKLTILSHKVKKRTLTLKVAVPSAGRLTATGKGLSKSSKIAKGRGIITLTLKPRDHRTLKTKVRLAFTPTKGRKLTAAVSARFKR